MKAQAPTIGLLEIDQDQISDGYILFSPWLSNSVFLINNCGEVVNRWETNLDFDLKMSYLDQEGNLLILSGDLVRKYDWNSNKIWELSSKDFQLIGHHDFELMPNGNILLIAREQFNYDESIALGFDSMIEDSTDVLIDGIYEFKHIENDSFDLVWKWNFADHLVQEIDSTISNFGLVKNEARKLDINFSNNIDQVDWLHCNGLNYNAALDQIIISSRNTSEIYIIDHSTTIEEASTSSGGNRGFGGDFLWRWGKNNLTGQHDPNWIPDTHPNAGMISVFNNVDTSDVTLYSSIKIIDPPLSAQGKYVLDTLNQFLPKEPKTIISGEPHGIYSPIMSGAHSQSNGNFVVCTGFSGSFYELNIEGDLLWKYINPVVGFPLPQFEIPDPGFTFNIRKYSSNFIGLEGKDLSPKGLIENENPVSESCILSTKILEPDSFIDLSVYPNPSQGIVHYKSEFQVHQVQIFALSGKKIMLIDNPNQTIDYPLERGTYIFQFSLKNKIINKLVSIL